jgi:hypothetical protein
MNGTLLGIASLAIVAANGAVFLSRMQRVAIPENRLAHDLGWAAALVLGVAAFASGVAWVGGVSAAIGAFTGGLMLLLRLGSPQAKNTPAVQIGGQILAFTAPDENDAPFSLAAVAGKPFLLKFFRGHW